MAELCEEEIDPRIKEELEKLNSATDQINSLELQLDEVRANFRQALTESTHSLNAISKKIGNVIEKARPYYEARQRAKEIQQETQKAALRFERACSMLAAAKEMVDLAEQGLFQDGRTFDANWQEMLNHATMKVGEAENERTLSVHEHLSTAAKFNDAEREVKRLQRSLRSAINKSRPYFESKASFNQTLEKQKRRVSELEKDVSAAKQVYSNALRKLEQISDQIHEQRRANASKLGQRESGVGAEASPIVSDSPSHHHSNVDLEVERLDLVIRHHRESTSPRQQQQQHRSKDDMDLSPTKSYPLPQRPLSLTDEAPAPDPHAIMTVCQSTEHLDDISDSISCKSEPMLDLDNDEEFDSGLDTLASRTISSLTFTGTEDLTFTGTEDLIDEKDCVFGEPSKTSESTEGCPAEDPHSSRESTGVGCEADSESKKEDPCSHGTVQSQSESEVTSNESRTESCDTDTRVSEDCIHVDKGDGDFVQEQKEEADGQCLGVDLNGEAEREVVEATSEETKNVEDVVDDESETGDHHEGDDIQATADQLFIEEEETFV